MTSFCDKRKSGVAETALKVSETRHIKLENKALFKFAKHECKSKKTLTIAYKYILYTSSSTSTATLFHVPNITTVTNSCKGSAKS